MTLAEAKINFERGFIANALACAGSATKAAEVLGCNRTHLHKRMRQLGLTSPIQIRRGRFLDA
jgi:DNA-binding NtrC family response regulator